MIGSKAKTNRGLLKAILNHDRGKTLVRQALFPPKSSTKYTAIAWKRKQSEKQTNHDMVRLTKDARFRHEFSEKVRNELKSISDISDRLEWFAATPTSWHGLSFSNVLTRSAILRRCGINIKPPQNKGRNDEIRILDRA